MDAHPQPPPAARPQGTPNTDKPDRRRGSLHAEYPSEYSTRPKRDRSDLGGETWTSNNHSFVNPRTKTSRQFHHPSIPSSTLTVIR
ncbi:hypothetical protein [Phormidium sp. CCY1219]|uniref:hypothetical protein n=1 Tax=Phormidium sp. CCY1219 TaxID=2886104 RepID=UPI002D1E64AA|nr:hypothetical protein [Phormidium sp. CCY1219]MEB3828030.1 hypothetical protein [Phormidium sp. CCY1219]